MIRIVQTLHLLPKRRASILLACLALGGCAGELGGIAAKAERPLPGADPAELRLVETALRAEAALTQLARIQSVKNPLEKADIPRLVPAELLKPVTLDWIGPLDGLAKVLAARAGFSFSTSGTPPPRPVIIDVASRKTPLIEVLRDAGLQAGRAGALVVDAQSRKIRVDWAAPAENG